MAYMKSQQSEFSKILLDIQMENTGFKGKEPDPNFHPYTEVEKAEDLMYMYCLVKNSFREAHDDLEQKRERVAMLRAKAENVGAVRYDKDRVQSSVGYTMDDVLMTISEAEYDAWLAYMVYIANVSSFEQIMTAAEFSEEQKRVWKLYYGVDGCSMAAVASALGITKWRVKYLLSTKFEVAFCQGINRIAQYAVCEM